MTDVTPRLIAIVENGLLVLEKSELDKACKCKKASPDLRVSI